MDLDIFLSALISLFVIVDPIGTSAVYTTLTTGETPEKARKQAIKAVLIAIIILGLVCLGGQFLLNHLGISFPAFKIAGGLLLFVTGFRMIMGSHDRNKLASDNSPYEDDSDIAVFPLAIPLLAGPGTMTAVLLHMTQVNTYVDKGMVIAAIILVQFVALICMFGAKRLAQLFGSTANSIMARIIGILMVAISVQFVADGLIEIIKGSGI